MGTMLTKLEKRQLNKSRQVILLKQQQKKRESQDGLVRVTTTDLRLNQT